MSPSVPLVRPERSLRSASPSRSPTALETKLRTLLKDPLVADDAAVVLGCIGHPAALRHLATMVQEGTRDRAERALHALGESRLPEAVPAISAGFDSRVHVVRREAFYALAKIGTPTAMKAMESGKRSKVLSDAGPAETDARFLNALGHWSGRASNGFERWLDHYARRGTPDQKHQAAVVRRHHHVREPSQAVQLQRLGRTDDAVGALLQTSATPAVKAAANIVGVVGTRKLASAVAGALTTPLRRPEERVALLGALQLLEHPEWKTHAARLARKDHDPSVRAFARELGGA